MGLIFRDNHPNRLTGFDIGNEVHDAKPYSAIDALAFRSGVKRDTLQKFLSGRTRTIKFSDADKIISKGMDSPGLWWEWPLLPLYLTVDLRDFETPYERQRAAVKERYKLNKLQAAAA